MSNKKWIWPQPIDQENLRFFSHALDLSWLTTAILFNRGLKDLASAKQFLDPSGWRFCDFHLFPGAAEAGKLLAEAIQRQEPIMIFGDYDADGITAAALLMEFIKQRQGQCQVYLPNRKGEGYGLNSAFVQKAWEGGTRLLITVDCGITAQAEVALANRLGLPVILTDHHEPSAMLPAATVLVNPKVSGPKELTDLAGVGIAFQVARATSQALGETDPERLRMHLDLVALGTVADIVPLTGENRILTRAGLAVLNRGQRLGLKALADVAGLSLGSLRTVDLAYRLAPRLNAAGRLGDARVSLDLLLTSDTEAAAHLAHWLNQENSRRQSLEQQALAQAESQLPAYPNLPLTLVVRDSQWPIGVIGLVASKLCEKYSRPCFVFSEEDGHLRGSGRSISAFPLQKILSQLSGYLEKWGGHELAAGITLAREQYDAFQTALQDIARTCLSVEQLKPCLVIDAQASLAALSFELVREFKRLEPFGYGNQPPQLAFMGMRLCQPPRIVGERHLKFRVTDNQSHFMEVIGFGLASRIIELEKDKLINLVGLLTENLWNGVPSLQIELKDFQVANQTT